MLRFKSNVNNKIDLLTRVVHEVKYYENNFDNNEDDKSQLTNFWSQRWVKQMSSTADPSYHFLKTKKDWVGKYYCSIPLTKPRNI